MAVGEALKAATPTLRDLANRCGVSYGSIRAYVAGTRNPGPQFLRVLAAAVRQQARLLTRHANRLDRWAGKEAQ